ncbi:MAG TPA: hypothetical protein VGR26_13425 [Acidimicrobiales bacterium]|nr:hypothetical protein [Acidimicrobiales bacterium]
MTESWLLAYEAVRREWVTDVSFGASPFFERLLNDGVTFLPPPDVDKPDDVSDWLDDHSPIPVATEGY